MSDRAAPPAPAGGMRPSPRSGQPDRSGRRLQAPAVRLGEQLRGLGRVESQLACTELRDLADRAQPAPRAPRAGDGWRTRWSCAPAHASQQLTRDVPNVGGVIDEVEVVEDQDGAVDRDRWELAQEGVEHGFAPRPIRTDLGAAGRSSPARMPGRVRGPRQPGGAGTTPSRDPSSSSRYHRVRSRDPPREVGEEGRLAVPGIGQDEDDAAVDLGAQPIQQPRTFERLVAERRTLHLRQLDRVAVDLGRAAGRSLAAPIRPPPGPTAIGDRSMTGREVDASRAGANDRERSRGVSTTGSGGMGVPHAAMVAHDRSSRD